MNKDVAPFASILWLDLDGLDNDERSKLIDPECWNEDYGELDENDDPVLGDNFTVRNWRLVGITDCGRDQHLHAPQWTDGTHNVWLLNESKYENVGCYDITAVANDHESLYAFIKDFGDIMPQTQWAGRIKTVEPIVQWS